MAVLAIGIPFAAITAKVFAELLDESPRQPLLALQASGVAPLQAFCYTLLPQAFPNLLSYAFYRFECSIRSAAVLGIIGAGGLGFQILLSLQSLRYEQMWTLLFMLCLLSGLSDMWSSLLRNRLHLTTRINLNLRKRNDNLPGIQAIGTQQHDPFVRISLLIVDGSHHALNHELGEVEDRVQGRA